MFQTTIIAVLVLLFSSINFLISYFFTKIFLVLLKFFFFLYEYEFQNNYLNYEILYEFFWISTSFKFSREYLATRKKTRTSYLWLRLFLTFSKYRLWSSITNNFALNLKSSVNKITVFGDGSYGPIHRCSKRQTYRERGSVFGLKNLLFNCLKANWRAFRHF